MKTQGWKYYLVFILLAEAVGVTAGLLTREASEIYKELVVKPVLSPPAVVFPVVWTILYALMGVSAARVWNSPESKNRGRGLNLFVAQLVVNFFWSLIFFNGQLFGFAFLWLCLLWVLVLLMILNFRKADSLAAWLQLPYLLWITFAGYLNYMVWQLNP